MKRWVFPLALSACLAAMTLAQNSKPSASLREGPLAGISHVDRNDSPDSLFFCPPKSCLYYAGDPDPAHFNGLFDISNPGLGITDTAVWVGVKPTADAVITGSGGNFSGPTDIGTNPTPFVVRTGIKPGQGGKIACQTSGNAIFQDYEDWRNISIKKLAKSCHFKANTVYYVAMVPQYNDGSTIGYLIDVEGKNPKHHQGWPNLQNHSYFNSGSFGASFQPTWGNGGACNGVGCGLFSISLTGK